MSNIDTIKKLTEDQNILLGELNSYGSVKAKEKNKYSCPLCSSSDGLGIISKDGKHHYKCFSCQEYGDVINLVSIKEGIEQGKAMKLIAERNGVDFPKTETVKAPRVNKNKIVEFYNKKTDEAIKEGDLNKAFELSCQADKESTKSYYIQFPHIDSKNNPLKIWENLEPILEKEGIYAVYNQITKDNEIKGLHCDGLSNQMMDIHSMANKYGFKVAFDFIGKSLSRIAEKHKYNPVENFLNECEFNWDEETGRIQQLCDTLEVTEWFPRDLRDKLVIKWLLNVANIPFNNIDKNNRTQGVLVVQGDQGIGKTTWVEHLIPIYLKTGLELDPSDKDKVYNCIKYWVCELGELDATMKADQAKLKAFITESVDEIRRPYAIAPERYPRKTAFYGTVNKSEFLKDETGDRRYWVIPVKNINIETLKEIDIPQLWGEVMHLLKSNTINLYLSKDELKELNDSNKDFRAKGALQIAVEEGFNWNTDKKYWNIATSAIIAKKLGLKTTSGLKEAIEAMGGEYKRTKNARGYLVPTFKDSSSNIIEWNNI
ncbi:MAG: VapE family protein [Romboutsia sp.]